MSLRQPHPVQEMHEKHLRIPFATITWPSPFSRFPHLNNDQVWHDMPSTFVQPRVHFPHVMLLRAFSKRQEAKRFRIEVRIGAEDIKNNARSGTVVTRANNHPI